MDPAAPRRTAVDHGDTAPRIEVVSARDVPLGGPRAMTVRRTLPQRARTLIGAWCFVDHYGPDDVADTGGMDVAPHPHIGLQTVSWLFSGEIEHRDSLGSHAFVRPGELNLMTSGHGISHSEVSTAATTILHGVQLWVALPEEHRHTGRDFRHHVPAPVRWEGAQIKVFLGSLAGDTSPVPTFTPLLGGVPFEERIVMWWNFIGRSHEEIVEARQAWEQASDRFGGVDGYDGDALPAPALPNTPSPPARTRSATERPTMAQPATAPAVRRVDARHRYEILVDGETAGFTAYRDRDDRRVFFHIEIGAAFAGQGLASLLVQQALTDVRASGMRSVPVCPYVAKFLTRHEDFADLADPVTPDILRWLETAPAR
ncbi:bifunctional pirin family protein/GNAT family N-acetyltransferase [Streptomyces ramulosus]|uniref:Bifunctional pirin family protein/GNAT family N-acetyltransferase n=1 Tax=Streptomyces ramulosus TaxID=47762 RepID=A0ABW1FGS3_9ACTN